MATPMESWDDDLDLHGQIHTNPQHANPHRSSISSRLSFRSDSNAGEQDFQLPLAPNDHQSASNAISSAKQAGIPLPENVPASALLGGSIKKLGNKRSRAKLNDDWDEDLEMPDAPSEGLKLKPRNTSAQNNNDANDLEEFDDWAEGSLGIRTGGTRNASKKDRSSSISAMSPSAASYNTFESEEDGLEGIVIPNGPVDFQGALKKRNVDDPKQNHASAHTEKNESTQQKKFDHDNKNKEEDFGDLDFGPGDVFEPQKHTLNRNIKANWKSNATASPASKAQTTLTFSNHPGQTRLPRPVSGSRPSKLEPVLEAGATSVAKPRRFQPTTTGAQLLKAKRSMPIMQSQRATNIRPPPLPAQQPGGRLPMPSQNHGRHNSDSNRAVSPAARMASRNAPGQTPDTPSRSKKDVAPAALAREAAARRTVTRPAKRRNFGDGSELEMFDDLPTSAAKENKFVKQPASRPSSLGLKSKPSQTTLSSARDKMTTPQPPPTPKSPVKHDNLPRFARDTAASRNAREQKLGQPAVTNKRSESALTNRTNWPSQVAARTPNSSPTAMRGLKRHPQLINPMGKENIRHFQDDAEKKGMHWNAALCRWEGNESALHPFEPPTPVSPPRPALIKNNNVNSTPAVQVVGGMVFDPQKMRWLKIGRNSLEAQQQNPMSPISMEDDDDDPFKDIEDLKDRPSGLADLSGDGSGEKAGGLTGNHGALTQGDWLVGEEFDLGPNFIQRQRDEEINWRDKVGDWFSADREQQRRQYGDAWLWSIRDIARDAEL